MKDEPTSVIVARLVAPFPALQGTQRITCDATAHLPSTPRKVAAKEGTMLKVTDEPYVVPAGEICACYGCELVDVLGALPKRLAYAQKRSLKLPAVRGCGAACRLRRG